MTKNRVHVPALVHHKPTNQGRVRINGRDFYLGVYGTPETDEAYRRFVAEYITTGKVPAPPTGMPVNELILLYYQHAEQYYRKNGEPTSELRMIRDSLRVVRHLYGSTDVEDFGPASLKTVRNEMIAKGWCRSEINKKISRVRRMFRWAVENEMVSPSLYHGLQAVTGLRRGRSEAKETEPIRPVEEHRINAVLPHVARQVKDMVRLQLLTGCRPGEVCILRPCDVNRDGEIWEYIPASHKTEHHGRGRIIFIGPKAQEILWPWLDNRSAETYCFSPAEAREERFANMRQKRRTLVQPSQTNRRKTRLKRQPRERYTTDSYGSAITLGCEKAFSMPTELRRIPKQPPKTEQDRFSSTEWEAERKRRKELAAEWRKKNCWSPNQLRHSRATYLRQNYGLESAQIILGHAKADITQVYAERDMAKARAVMAEVG